MSTVTQREIAVSGFNERQHEKQYLIHFLANLLDKTKETTSIQVKLGKQAISNLVSKNSYCIMQTPNQCLKE